MKIHMSGLKRRKVTTDSKLARKEQKGEHM